MCEGGPVSLSHSCQVWHRTDSSTGRYPAKGSQDCPLTDVLPGGTTGDLVKDFGVQDSHTVQSRPQVTAFAPTTLKPALHLAAGLWQSPVTRVSLPPKQ